MAQVAGGGGSRSPKIGSSRTQKNPNTYGGKGLTYVPGAGGKPGRYVSTKPQQSAGTATPRPKGTRPNLGTGVSGFKAPTAAQAAKSRATLHPKK